MTKERLLKIIDNILAWGNDHDEDFRECLLYAMDLTEDEINELGLQNYVDDEEDEDEDEDDPRGNNTCPYCGKDADFVDDDEDSTKYYCPHCGEDFLVYDDGTYHTRNGFPIKEE